MHMQGSDCMTYIVLIWGILVTYIAEAEARRADKRALVANAINGLVY